MNHRIVSLLPAATEIVCALGGESWLVGRSHECDFPSRVLSLPVCSQPRIDVSGSSRDIDERVKNALHDGLSLFEVDLKRLSELNPTLILTQAQCEVCAVSLADVEAALASHVGSRPRIVSLIPNSLNDVFNDIRHIATALEMPKRGETLIADLMNRSDRIQSDCQVTAGESRPSVVCIEWFEPLMTAGNWVPELVAMAGGQNLLSERGHHSPWLEWTSLVAADPEVIILMPCGWTMTRARDEIHWLTERREWGSLKAAKNQRVFLVDGHHYFNRPGPRLIDSAEIIAEILHPESCHYGHRGVGWEPL